MTPTKVFFLPFEADNKKKSLGIGIAGIFCKEQYQIHGYLKLHETQTFMLPPMGAMYDRHNVRTSNCKLRSLQSACRCGLCVLLHTDKIQQERSKNAPKLGQTIKYFMCLWLKLMHVNFKKI